MAQTERSSSQEVSRSFIVHKYRHMKFYGLKVRSFVFSLSDIGHPYSLDVFEGHVYWTTKDKGEVWRTNKFGEGSKVKVLTINPWLTQVRIYHEHRHNQSGQNTEYNKCNCKKNTIIINI